MGEKGGGEGEERGRRGGGEGEERGAGRGRGRGEGGGGGGGGGEGEGGEGVLSSFIGFLNAKLYAWPTYIHTYIHTYIYIYVYVYIHTYLWNVSMSVSLHVYMFVYMRIHVCIEMGRSGTMGFGDPKPPEAPEKLDTARAKAADANGVLASEASFGISGSCGLGFGRYSQQQGKRVAREVLIVEVEICS